MSEVNEVLADLADLDKQDNDNNRIFFTFTDEIRDKVFSILSSEVIITNATLTLCICKEQFFFKMFDRILDEGDMYLLVSGQRRYEAVFYSVGRDAITFVSNNFITDDLALQTIHYIREVCEKNRPKQSTDNDENQNPR